MVMAKSFVVAKMSISHLNVCTHRLTFAKKEGFGKAVMQRNSDRQEREVGHVKNIICKVWKCCYFFSLSIVQLSVTFLSSLRVSCRILARCNLLGKGVRSSSSCFRWSKGPQHVTKCMHTPNGSLFFTRPLEGGGGDGEDARGPLPFLASKLVLIMQPPPKKS
jgi:hypothetical protein